MAAIIYGEPDSLTNEIVTHPNLPGFLDLLWHGMNRIDSKFYCEGIWLLTLLVVMLPNLRSLKIPDNWFDAPSEIAALFAFALEQQVPSFPSFSQLKSLIFTNRPFTYHSIDSIGNGYGIDWNDCGWDGAMSFFYCPNLETLSLNFPWRYSRPEVGPPMHLGKLVTLDISGLQERDLGTVLMRTPKLKELFLTTYYFSNDHNAHIFFDCHQLQGGLLKVEDTLESLKLVLDMILHDDSFQWGLRRNFRLGNGYKRLRTLEIPLVPLLGWSQDTAPEIGAVLPAYIDHLIITDDLWWASDGIYFQWTSWGLLKYLRRFINGKTHKLLKKITLKLDCWTRTILKEEEWNEKRMEFKVTYTLGKVDFKFEEGRNWWETVDMETRSPDEQETSDRSNAAWTERWAKISANLVTQHQASLL